jgi:anti-sigma regulatory factor (Ser/Thr protein kinase)
VSAARKPVASPQLRISLRGGFRIDRLEKVIGEIEKLSRLEEPRRLVLDLGGLVFISPASLAMLLSAVAGAMERGAIAEGSTYLPPTNRLVARYLDRVDFNMLLTGAHLDDGFERRPSAGSRPIQVFTEEADLEELASSLTMAATEAFPLSGKDKVAVLLAISEITQNVIDHAGSAVGGFAIAQRGLKRREFEIAVSDPGVGIAASLRRNAQYQDVHDDAKAITLALSPGVTSNPESLENIGVGLAAIQGLLRENRGTLLVRSGRAAVEDGASARVQPDLVHLRGTLVALRMHAGQPFDLALFKEMAHRRASIAAEEVERAPEDSELE